MSTIRPAPLRSRCGRQRPHEPDRREQQQLDRGLDRLVGDVERRDAAAGRRRCRTRTSTPPNRSTAVATRRSRSAAFVTSPRRRAPPSRSASRSSASRAAREHRDVRALVGERLRAAEAEPGGGAADDRRPAGEPEFHRRRVAAADAHQLERRRLSRIARHVVRTDTTSRTSTMPSCLARRRRGRARRCVRSPSRRARPARPCRGRRSRTRPRGTRCRGARASRRGRSRRPSVRPPLRARTRRTCRAG